MSLCILFDNKMQVTDSFVSPTNSLANCLSQKDLRYSRLYFANPVNARVMVSDVSVICLFVDHRDYCIMDNEASVLQDLMQYLKGVLCFNMNRAVLEDVNSHKASPEVVLARCQDKIQTKSASTRNSHLLDILQLVHFFAAYQFLLKSAKGPEKPNPKLLEEKEEVFFTLYHQHKGLMLQVLDDSLSRFYEDLCKKSKAKNRIAQDIEEESSRERAIETVDIEILSNNSNVRSNNLAKDHRDLSSPSSATKEQLKDLKIRIQEFHDWQKSVNRKPLVSVEAIRESYKKIPIAEKKLDDAIEVARDQEDLKYLHSMKAMMKDGTTRLNEELLEYWSIWKSQMQNAFNAGSSESSLIKELSRIEVEIVSMVNNLVVKYSYFRRFEPISLIFDKMEISASCLSLLKIYQKEPNIRLDKPPSLFKTHQDRIAQLLDRIKPSEMNQLPIYLHVSSKFARSNSSTESGKTSSPNQRRHRNKANDPSAKSTSVRSVSTSNLRKRGPDINQENEKTISDMKTSKPKDTGSTLVPENASSTDSSAERLSKSMQISFKDSTPGRFEQLISNHGGSKSSLKMLAPVLSKPSSGALASLQPVSINLELRNGAELSLTDIDLLLKRYSLGALFSNDKKFEELRKWFSDTLAIQSAELRSVLPSSLKVMLSPTMTYAYAMMLLKVRDQTLSSCQEIKIVLKEISSKQANKDIKKLVYLASFFVFRL